MQTRGTLGIVLAGGQSRRMGRDKALLEWRGKPVMAHLREQLLRAGCARALISRNAPGYITDVFPGAGPLAGIHAVARAVPAPGYLVMPVDMPLLSESTLQGLRRLGECRGTGHTTDAILPCYLDASDPNRLARILQERLMSGRLSLHGLLEELDARVWPLGVPEEFVNANDPRDWKEVRAVGHQTRETAP